VTHPIQCIDLITVADLATWKVAKMTYLSPKLRIYSEEMARVYGKDGSANYAYICHAVGDALQKDFFSPIGVLLSTLYSRLAWTFLDMRQLEEYFRKVNLQGSGTGKMRQWPITIYSSAIRERIYNGALSNGISYDEWSVGFC
jgi:hypothetical protein